MTLDLWILVATVVFTWLLIMVDATPSILNNGLPWAVGNREETPDPDGVYGRIHRCSLNMQENLPIFAALVLVAHVSGEADAMSTLGAEIFLGARIVHAGVYFAGIPWARTLIWSVSIAGMGLIVYSLFG